MNQISPGMGHNRPPPEDRAATLKAELQPWLAAWKAYEALESLDDTQAGELSDFVKQVEEVAKGFDAERVAYKRPHDDAAKAIQKAFLPLIEPLEVIASRGKARLEAFMREEHARALSTYEEALAGLVQAIAAKEGQVAMAKAEADIEQELALQAELEALWARRAELVKPTRPKVSSATGAGRSRTIREIRTVRIVNLGLALVALKNEPEVQEAILKAGNRRVRAKDFDGRPIPGLETYLEGQVT